MGELLDEKAVAKRLGVEQKTLQAWRSRGSTLPFLKIGRLVKYAPEDVQQFIESRRRRSTSE
jgi:excisionase family DNA binding protein